MKAKKGKRIEPVTPPSPEETLEADEASPGKVAEIKATQLEKGVGKYGKTTLPAHKPAHRQKGSGVSSRGSSGKGRSGSSSGQTGSGDAPDSDKGAESGEGKKDAWVGIFLSDEEGNAVVGQKYEVILPDGTLSKGTTGQDGKAKVEGFDAGTCKVSFPDLVSGSVSKK